MRKEQMIVYNRKVILSYYIKADKLKNRRFVRFINRKGRFDGSKK